MPDEQELHDQLTEIRGVGDATADSILDVLDEHRDEAAQGEVSALLDDAVDYAVAGEHEYAMKFVRQARDRLFDD